MAKYFAIPLRADGTEELGTFGVLTGNYGSYETFVRYLFGRYSCTETRYNVYTVHNQTWHLVRADARGTTTLPALVVTAETEGNGDEAVSLRKFFRRCQRSAHESKHTVYAWRDEQGSYVSGRLHALPYNVRTYHAFLADGRHYPYVNTDVQEDAHTQVSGKSNG